jgi:hypothetical protein
LKATSDTLSGRDLGDVIIPVPNPIPDGTIQFRTTYPKSEGLFFQGQDVMNGRQMALEKAFKKTIQAGASSSLQHQVPCQSSVSNAPPHVDCRLVVVMG